MNWKNLLLGLPVFLLAITLHEVAHAWTADRLGDKTAREQGRLTLNPLAHLDPLGTLFFFLSALTGWGFGWAKPVPVNFMRLGSRPFQKMMLIAAAGPLSNLLQAGLWYGLFWGVVGVAMAIGEGWWLRVGLFLCLQGVVINLLLMFFNLLPIPPLDGSRIVGGLLPMEWAVRWYQLSAFGFLILLLFLQTPLFDLLVINPMERLLAVMLGDWW